MAATDQQILDAVKDLILALVTTGGGIIESTSLGGKGARTYTMDELQRLEQYYSRKVGAASRPRFLQADLTGGNS